MRGFLWGIIKIINIDENDNIYYDDVFIIKIFDGKIRIGFN